MAVSNVRAMTRVASRAGDRVALAMPPSAELVGGDRRRAAHGRRRCADPVRPDDPRDGERRSRCSRRRSSLRRRRGGARPARGLAAEPIPRRRSSSSSRRARPGDRRAWCCPVGRWRRAPTPGSRSSHPSRAGRCRSGSRTSRASASCGAPSVIGCPITLLPPTDARRAHRALGGREWAEPRLARAGTARPPARRHERRRAAADRARAPARRRARSRPRSSSAPPAPAGRSSRRTASRRWAPASRAAGRAAAPGGGCRSRSIEPGRDGVGEIVVAGPSRFSGYLGEQPAAPDEPFRTGDLGRLDEDGRLVVVDRRTDRIVRGGENIDPGEVEAVLEAHPAIATAAVVGRPDETWGQVPVAAVVLADGATDPGDDALATHARASPRRVQGPGDVHSARRPPADARRQAPPRRRPCAPRRATDRASSPGRTATPSAGASPGPARRP